MLKKSETGLLTHVSDYDELEQIQKSFWSILKYFLTEAWKPCRQPLLLSKFERGLLNTKQQQQY
jgi:hypothetical protein